MLDEPSALDGAVHGYREAAIRARIKDFPGPMVASPSRPVAGVEEACRIFDVSRIPAQLQWTLFQRWSGYQILPEGGYPWYWPVDRDVLDDLVLTVGVPFAWRRQVPLFRWDHEVFMFVLDPSHEGEIWRYEISHETAPTAVRAAASLADLFVQWTQAIDAGLIENEDGTLYIEMGRPADVYARFHEAGLDPIAFPSMSTSHPDYTRRQNACGVEMSPQTDHHGHDPWEALARSVRELQDSLGR